MKITLVKNFLCLYRSPSQKWDIFETFSDNLELTLDTTTNKNRFFSVATSDFNAKTTNWYKNDTKSYEGLKIDAITSQFGLQQLPNKAEGILSDIENAFK